MYKRAPPTADVAVRRKGKQEGAAAGRKVSARDEEK